MHLSKKKILKNPMRQFDLWYKDAEKLKLKHPNAMNISTVNKKGRPTNRMVLLKKYNNTGFYFYTNYKSQKGKDIANNPYVALTFYWEKLNRQVRIEGRAKKVSISTSNTYFNSRERLSQIGALASSQSEVLDNYQELQDKFDLLKKEYKNKKIPRPKYWGGFCIAPDSIEFWQGRNSRMHDRLLFKKKKARWVIERLSP